MDLFAAPPSPSQLVSDPEGGILYWPEVASADQADVWFDTLHERVDWQAQRRKMYERMVDVPRLLAAYHVEAMPPRLPLAEILAQVQARVPARYNAIGLNLYRDGRDSVAMHHDKLHTIVPGHPIALLSLGEPRRMLIRPRFGAGSHEASRGIDLAHGSLLAMSHASQLSHEHGIPKTRRPVGPRISVVFRVRPDGGLAE